MFDNLLMSMNSKLKKIMSGLETNEGKIDEISTSVSNTYTKANSAASNTATNNTASKTGVLSAKLAYIISLLENTTYGLSALKTASSNSGGLTSCVRKIQRGTVSFSNISRNSTTSVTLNGFYNIDKLCVIINGSGLVSGEGASLNPYISSLTLTTLTLTNPYKASIVYTLSYQVIEFY